MPSSRSSIERSTPFPSSALFAGDLGGGPSALFHNPLLLSVTGGTVSTGTGAGG
jgi:hypothetical protein